MQLILDRIRFREEYKKDPPTHRRIFCVYDVRFKVYGHGRKMWASQERPISDA